MTLRRTVAAIKKGVSPAEQREVVIRSKHSKRSYSSACVNWKN